MTRHENPWYWKTLGVDDFGEVLQQRYQLIGGDTLVPTGRHRIVQMPEGEVVEVLDIP